MAEAIKRLRFRERPGRDKKAAAFQKGFTRTYAIHCPEQEEATHQDPLLWLGDVYGQCARGDNPFYSDETRNELSFLVRPRRTGLVIGAHDVIDTADHKIGHIEQRIATRGAWSVHDASGNELLRLVDPQSLLTKTLMTAFDGTPDQWALVDGETLLGTVRRRKAPDPRRGRRGLRALLLEIFWGSEWAFDLTPAAEHIDRRLLAGLGIVFLQITIAGYQSA